MRNKISIFTNFKLIVQSALIFLLILFSFLIVLGFHSQLVTMPAKYDAYKPSLNAEWGGVRIETTGGFYCDDFFTSVYKCDFDEFISEYWLIWFLIISFPLHSIPILMIPIILIYLYVRHRHRRR
jgi:hypothetical protein